MGAKKAYLYDALERMHHQLTIEHRKTFLFDGINAHVFSPAYGGMMFLDGISSHVNDQADLIDEGIILIALKKKIHKAIALPCITVVDDMLY
ncbi:hypothetical protein CR513_37561, partial [Mucuna pruriens]